MLLPWQEAQLAIVQLIQAVPSRLKINPGWHDAHLRTDSQLRQFGIVQEMHWSPAELGCSDPEQREQKLFWAQVMQSGILQSTHID